MAWVLTIALLFVLCRLTRNKSATVPDVCPDCCLCDCAEKGCGYLRKPNVEWVACSRCNTRAVNKETLTHFPDCSHYKS